MKKQWCAAVVLRNYEFAFGKAMRKKRLGVYVPASKSMTKPKNKHKPVETLKPWLAGYAFVNMSKGKRAALEYDKLRSSNLFFCLLGPISNKTMKQIKQRERLGDFDAVFKERAGEKPKVFEAGTLVCFGHPLGGKDVLGVVHRNTNGRKWAHVSVGSVVLQVSISLITEFRHNVKR